MYKLDNVWEKVVECLNLPLNSEISTNGIYTAIISVTGFTRNEGISDGKILSLEKKQLGI